MAVLIKRIEFSTDYLNRKVTTETQVLFRSDYEINDVVREYFNNLSDDDMGKVEYDSTTDDGHEYEVKGELVDKLLGYLEVYCDNFDIDEFNEDKVTTDYNYAVELF